MLKQDFLGSLVVKTSSSSAGGVGSIPGGGARVALASWPKKKKKKIKHKQYYNKFDEDFKNGPHKKIL